MFTGARSSKSSAAVGVGRLARAERASLHSKTGRKTIHLPPPALDVLARPAAGLTSNPFVIFGERAGATRRPHFVGVHKPWRRILDATAVVAWSTGGGAPAELVAGLEARLGRAPTAEECRLAAEREGVDLPEHFAGLRLHDLRHAFASVAAGSGLGLPIIGKLLGHTQPATTNRYAHLAADPLSRRPQPRGEHRGSDGRGCEMTRPKHRRAADIAGGAGGGNRPPCGSDRTRLRP